MGAGGGGGDTNRSCWALSVQERSEGLRNPSLNPRLGEGGNRVEVVTATCGSASLLVEDCCLGRRIVETVTRRALREAPGLAVTGAVVQLEGREGFQAAFRRAGRELNRIRSRLPGPEFRFRQIPIVDRCRTTGLPAAGYDIPLGQEPPEPLSATVRPKLAASMLTPPRLQAERWIEHRDRLARTLAGLERGLEQAEERWLAVIHADGNGLRTLLARLGQVQPGGDPIEAIRLVSTGQAFNRALTAAVTVWEREQGKAASTPELLVVPLVVGSDDPTVVCEGSLAMAFTLAYLQGFEAMAGSELGELLRAVRAPGLTASAGLALVKPHYPLHGAYDLAEQLTESAKLGKHHTPNRSALDFHLQLNTTDTDLGRIRQRRRSRGPEPIALWGGPYVLDKTSGWGAMPTLEQLGRVVRVLRRRENGPPLVSSSLVHCLQVALAGGRTARRGRDGAGPLQPRSRPLAGAADCGRWTVAGSHPPDPATGAGAAEEPAYATALFDAIDLVGLWDGKLEERP